MKCLKTLGLAVIAAIAMVTLAASSASASTLEIGGVTQNKSVTITASEVPDSSMLLGTTSGGFANTCLESHLHFDTDDYTGFDTEGPIYALALASCTNEKVVVDKACRLSIAWTSGTNGTVTSSGAELTVPSPIGALNCKTGSGTDIGTLTGKASGSAVLDIKAVLNCGFLVPSAKWECEYFITSPQSLGVEP